jgi:hypothetical protein
MQLLVGYARVDRVDDDGFGIHVPGQHVESE